MAGPPRGARGAPLLDEILKTVVGDDHHPGDSTASEHWPGVAPGTRGILNALSPRYWDWTGLVDVDSKPPVLWTYGTEDVVISNASAWDIGTLGQSGAVPGWPGAEAFPPQPMLAQTEALLERYRAAAARYRDPLPAAILSAEHAIGVRHGCFCAHSLMTELLRVPDGEARALHAELAAGRHPQLPGAGRASLGLGSTASDVDLLAALRERRARAAGALRARARPRRVRAARVGAAA